MIALVNKVIFNNYHNYDGRYAEWIRECKYMAILALYDMGWSRMKIMEKTGYSFSNIERITYERNVPKAYHVIIELIKEENK